MAKKVAWTESAWSDLSDVADYIAKDSPNYAAVFVQEVKDVSMTLKALAERGRRVPEFGDSSIRELFIKSYRLIYAIQNDMIYIIAFIHGARDLSSLWEQEGREQF